MLSAIRKKCWAEQKNLYVIAHLLLFPRHFRAIIREQLSLKLKNIIFWHSSDINIDVYTEKNDSP